MSFVAYLDDLDEAVPMCPNPSCPRCQSMLLLTASCHRESGLRVEPCEDCGDVVHLSCASCRRPLFGIAIEGPARVAKDCRHTKGFEVEYKDGQLWLSCRRCAEPAGELLVAVRRNLRDI
jgi:hypothetical protein